VHPRGGEGVASEWKGADGEARANEMGRKSDKMKQNGKGVEARRGRGREWGKKNNKKTKEPPQ